MSRSYNSKEAQAVFKSRKKWLKAFGYQWTYAGYWEETNHRGPLGSFINPLTNQSDIFEEFKYVLVLVNPNLKYKPRLKKDDRRAENKTVRQEAKKKIHKFIRCKAEDVVMSGLSKNHWRYW